MKNIVVIMFVISVFFSVSGCTGGGGTRDQSITVSGSSYASDSSLLYKEISLGAITGKNSSNVWNYLTGINITPEFLKSYRNKVSQDLNEAYLLSTNKKGKYLLDIIIQEIDSSFVGSGYTTKMKYLLKTDTGKMVWEKEIQASHSVSFLKEPNSSARLHKSKLGALTKNSELYVRELVNKAPSFIKK